MLASAASILLLFYGEIGYSAAVALRPSSEGLLQVVVVVFTLKANKVKVNKHGLVHISWNQIVSHHVYISTHGGAVLPHSGFESTGELGLSSTLTEKHLDD